MDETDFIDLDRVKYLNKMKNIYHINNKKNDPDSFRNGSLEMNWKPSIFVGSRFDVAYEGNNYYRDNHKT